MRIFYDIEPNRFTDSFAIGRTALWVTLMTLVLVAGCSQQPTVPTADPSLRSVERGNFDHVFLPAGERLPRFNRVFIEAPEVSMSDYWLRERRTDYTERDLNRIETTYRGLLAEALASGLERDTQVELVATPEEAEVIFRPSLRELNIYAADLTGDGITRYYTHQAGNATFDLVLLDQAGNVVGQFIDHRETPSFAGRRLERANRVTNVRHFRRLMDRWTNNLTTYLLNAGAVPERSDD